MDRSIIYSQEQGRSFDFCNFEKDVCFALGRMYSGVMGLAPTSATVIDGFAATQTSPASLSVNLAGGHIYQVAAIDPTGFGALPSDSSNIYNQGRAAAQVVALTTAGLSSGQKQWALIEVQFQTVDAVRASDPNGGIPLFWNSSNPASPLNGQSGNGFVIPTVRQGFAAVQVIYGTAVASGSEVPPAVTAGWTPMYLVDLAFGQTTILNGQIVAAGPSVGPNVPSNYAQSPFVAGLLSSHHNGKLGQAPKIQLTSAAEVQGILPLSNMPTSSSPNGGGLSTVQVFQGNPNGSMAGNAGVPGVSPPDLVWDSLYNIFWACTNSGTTTTAVWNVIARQKLLTPLTVYVSSTGDDVHNNGLFNTSPFQTGQRAWNEIINKVDLNGFQVTIQVLDGTYSGTNFLTTTGLPVGACFSTPVIIQGNVVNPQNVIINSSSHCFDINGALAVQIQGCKVKSTAGHGFFCRNGATLQHNNMQFDQCGISHMHAEFLGQVIALGGYAVVGDAACHYDIALGGQIKHDGVSVTFSGSRTFSIAYARAQQCGVLQHSNITIVGSQPTCARYSGVANAVINTLGQSTSYLPGNTAGALVSGAQYV